MPLLPWSNELSVGITSIDEQHKQLISLINELNKALQDGKANQVLNGIFDELLSYTVKHFGYEEKLFAQYNYENTETHKEEHKKLISQVKKLKSKMMEGDFMISIEVLAFLKDWLINHIMKTDKAYDSYTGVWGQGCAVRGC